MLVKVIRAEKVSPAKKADCNGSTCITILPLECLDDPGWSSFIYVNGRPVREMRRQAKGCERSTVGMRIAHDGQHTTTAFSGGAKLDTQGSMICKTRPNVR